MSEFKTWLLLLVLCLIVFVWLQTQHLKEIHRIYDIINEPVYIWTWLVNEKIIIKNRRWGDYHGFEKHYEMFVQFTLNNEIIESKIHYWWEVNKWSGYKNSYNIWDVINITYGQNWYIVVNEYTTGSILYRKWIIWILFLFEVIIAIYVFKYRKHIISGIRWLPSKKQK